MRKFIKKWIRDRLTFLTAKVLKKFVEDNEKSLMALGTLLANQQKSIISTNLNDYEFRITSQVGDDGIIQFLVSNLEIENKTFVEFGVENYTESNTRFLLMKDNWTGLVIDGSSANIKSIKKDTRLYSMYDLRAVCAFITKDNINSLIENSGISGEIGLLSIDIDGNDYWVWQSISVINPIIVIVEYNALFGKNLYSIPYEEDFIWHKKHYSHLYWGASLTALNYLAEKKGYSFVGCNQTGINAYFVRNDKLNSRVVAKSATDNLMVSKFRQSRDVNGKPTFLSNEAAYKEIKGLKVVDVSTNEVTYL